MQNYGRSQNFCTNVTHELIFEIFCGRRVVKTFFSSTQ